MAATEFSIADDGIAPQPTFEPLDAFRVPTVESRMAIKNDYVVDVQEFVATPSLSGTTTPFKETPGLYITGLGSQYPPFLFQPANLEGYLKKWYDLETPGIKKLLTINDSTLIKHRSTIKAYEDPFWSRSTAPSISELDRIFRKAGVDLAVQACKKAMRESGYAPSDITHIVAVTCTNAGNPGFDLLVAQKLGLRPETDRTLLHGVGCAGGLSAMRAAASMAQSASMRGREARVLVFACEICSTNVRCDLEEVVEHPEETRISPVLFSDGAASFVLSNELTPGAKDTALYSLINWETATMPGTAKELEFMADPFGFRTTLTKEVPNLALKAISPMFEQMKPFLPSDSNLALSGKSVEAKDFDWALHPGGIAILDGVQNKMELHDEQLRASFDVYKNHGNSSSPTVLIVLDQLRKMGEGRENVMACSFGPGMTIEMALLKRCVRDDDE